MASAERQIGVLLVTGNQTHQENYGRAFAADPRCRIVGVSDGAGIDTRRHRLNLELADELGVPLFDDYAEALAEPGVQIVSICADPERRAALTADAIRAGKHVYLDKEPATTRKDAEELVQLANEHGVRSQTFSLVRSQLARDARQILQDKPADWLRELHAEMFFAKGFPGTADLTQPRKEKATATRFTFLDSKRELLCVGWYPLVLFCWLTGQRYESVHALTANYFFAEHQRNDVEDFATMLLAMSGDLAGSITVGRTGWQTHPGFGIHQLTLIGDGEVITLDGFTPRWETYSEKTAWSPPQTPHPEDPMGFWSSTQAASGIAAKRSWLPVETEAPSDAAAFVDAIEACRPSDVDISLAAHVLDAVLTGYESAAAGRWIDVER